LEDLGDCPSEEDQESSSAESQPSSSSSSAPSLTSDAVWKQPRNDFQIIADGMKKRAKEVAAARKRKRVPKE